MPLRRFGRPGLLNSIGRDGVIAGTTAMTSSVLHHHPEQRAADVPASTGRQEGADAQSSGAPVPDLVSQLSELAELRISGAMTEEEFRNAKARLLTR